ncbi:YwqG family protein [Streptomyces sp. NBC_00237]|uniref:DUF1963 domain-containing protein n=1 Tax=Streptomyces sp. NBC_00237 TaxID=2975687 RepID=UPI002255C126|nr:DUF1963 domain-containing protein [Streptomyces sp. NBC_00237]MCX5203080.1 YwqG family protein [Streptomyces sp. NBC_00237]
MTPRPNPLTPADEAALRAAIEQEGLTQWTGDIVAVAEHCVKLKAVDPASSTAFSRSGVLPSVPPGFAWPTEEPYEDEPPTPLAFVAQVDLAEVADADANGLLPPAGLLYFFHPNGEAAYGDVLRVPVLYFPDATPADTVAYDMANLAGAVEYEEAWGVPPYEFESPAAFEPRGRGMVPRHLHVELGIRGVELEYEESDLIVDRVNALDDAFGPDAGLTLLGPDDDFDCDLRASAAELVMGERESVQGGRIEYDGVRPEVQRERHQWRVLLDVGSTDSTGCPMYFLIRDDALAAGDFSNVIGASVQW